MKVPLKWLGEYVHLTLPPDELAKKLTMSGTDVGAIETIGGWETITVGEVVAIAPHPNADRLKLATVDLGGERLTSVCGAPNVAPGQKIPFAPIGAQFLDSESGQRIRLKKSKIRGVTSEGMICSERELGISDHHEGIMVLPPDAPVGIRLDEYLGDTILDMDLTPNRPDLLSIIGIAREVAALTVETINIPDSSYVETGEPIARQASVEIHDPDLCPRYCASLITAVTIGPSPAWLEQRLLACGMRPINNIVDVTNYVMLEYGQPLHAFDFDNIADRKIIVRRAANESMRTLDGVARQLSDDMLVIADGMGPVAVAGVMGGAESEVTGSTTSILLESANFNAGSIRRTSNSFKLRSEASLRFEKGLSPDLPLPALKRATQLIAELSGGKIAAGVIDIYPGKKGVEPLFLTTKKVARVLGIEISYEKIVTVLESLGFQCTPKSTGELMVAIPYWRTDVRLAEDLVEEIARIIGYDELPTTLPSGALPAYAPDPIHTLKKRISDILVGCGMQEVISYSLTSIDRLQRILPQTSPLKVANPITTEQEYLRTSLRPGLLQVLSANEKHEENGIRLFEVDKVYFPQTGDLPEERHMLAGVLCGTRHDRSWHGESDMLDFFDAKGILETLFQHLGIEAVFEPTDDPTFSPGSRATIMIEGENVGTFGELHPRIAEYFSISIHPISLFEIDVQRLLPATTAPRQYRPIPRFPITLRDIAVVVDAKTPAKSVQDIIEGSPLVTRVTLFDVYTGKQVSHGKKSLAFRIEYQSPSRTLTDEEVNRDQHKTFDRLSKELNATLRQ
jgi:phenylalanyl-tRNA synthetase beta chain